MRSIIILALAIFLAPLYSALILKVKAFFGGKKGPPLLINYFTLGKLFKKGSVYSTSTTFVFKLGPMVSLSTAVTVLMFLPIAGQPPLFSFNGDIILLLYLFGLGRFFTERIDHVQFGFGVTHDALDDGDSRVGDRKFNQPLPADDTRCPFEFVHQRDWRHGYAFFPCLTARAA